VSFTLHFLFNLFIIFSTKPVAARVDCCCSVAHQGRGGQLGKQVSQHGSCVAGSRSTSRWARETNSVARHRHQVASFLLSCTAFTEYVCSNLKVYSISSPWALTRSWCFLSKASCSSSIMQLQEHFMTRVGLWVPTCSGYDLCHPG